MNIKANKTFPAVVAIAIIFALGAAAFLPASPVSAAAPERRGGPNTGGGYGTAAGGYAAVGTALTPLSTTEEDALKEAILEEYGALNLYNAVLAQLGSQVPFSQIVRSEQQHVNALLRQADKYGVEAPANPGLTNPPTFATLAEACAAGVSAEIADAALYDELKPVTTHSDLLQVYDRLQSASLNSHLPAFEACN